MLFQQASHSQFHLHNDCVPTPEFRDRSPRRSPGLALESDQPKRRQIDKLQIWSWNPGPSRGSDPILLTSHLNGPCHVICVQDGSGCVTDSSLAENFYVATQHFCTVLFNKDTFKRDFSCTPFQVHCSRQLPDMGCGRHGVLWQIPQTTRLAQAQ